MGQCGSLAGLKGAQKRQPLIESVGDYLLIAFQRAQAQQPIVIGRLLLGWDAEPDVIGVEMVGHVSREC